MGTDNGHRELSLEEQEARCERAHYLLEELEEQGIGFRLVEGEVLFRPASRISDVARAELRSYKDEIYELLREEECNARRDAHLASQPEIDELFEAELDEGGEWGPIQTMLSAEFGALGELGYDRENELMDWIEETLESAPEKTERYRHDSYELKHIFERSPEGFYVTDEQFRAAMRMTNHPGRRYPTPSGRDRKGTRYEDLETRYYYLRPNREGFIEKLTRAGVPANWARDVIMPDAEEGGVTEGNRKEL